MTHRAAIAIRDSVAPGLRPGQVRQLADAAMDSHSPGTRRNYAAAWERFSRWAGREGLDAIPALPETVAAYLGLRPAIRPDRGEPDRGRGESRRAGRQLLRPFSQNRDGPRSGGLRRGTRGRSGRRTQGFPPNARLLRSRRTGRQWRGRPARKVGGKGGDLQNDYRRIGTGIRLPDAPVAPRTRRSSARRQDGIGGNVGALPQTRPVPDLSI